MGQYYSFLSQWLVTDCLCYTSNNYQGDKHQSSTRPRPSTSHSNWLLVCYPVKPVLRYHQNFCYFSVVKWHLLVVVRWSVSAPHGWWYWMMRWNKYCYKLRVGSCPLLEGDRTATSTDWRGEGWEVEVGQWGQGWGWLLGFWLRQTSD